MVGGKVKWTDCGGHVTPGRSGPFCATREDAMNNNLSGTVLAQNSIRVVSLIHEAILKDHAILREITSHSAPTNMILVDPQK